MASIKLFISTNYQAFKFNQSNDSILSGIVEFPGALVITPEKKLKLAGKVKRRRKPKKVENDEYMENKREAKKLQERFSKKKTREDEGVFLKVGDWASVPRVCNSDAHTNMISRAEEAKINKIYQIDFRPEILHTHWKCALCGEQTARQNLGDLFGPYYVQLGQVWPSLLIKKHKGAVDNSWIDVWFHGDCILWAPDVHMKANQLTNLSEKLPVFWKQNCILCHHEGATIPVGNNRHVHFPCAVTHGYKMNDLLLSCRPPNE